MPMAYSLISSVRFYPTLSFYTLTLILTTMTIDSYACRHCGLRNYYFRDQIFDNVYITDEELAYFETKSALTCFISCEDSQQCKSYSYNALSSVCQHFNVPFWTISVSGVKQSGWIHYDQPRPKDCTDMFKLAGQSRVYTIYPATENELEVFCKMNVSSGGWTVLQHRMDGSVDFYRDWNSYKYGFGSLTSEFWLGNEYIHKIVLNGDYTLRIELEDFDGERRFAEYSTFVIGSESSGYKLDLGEFSGNAGDGMEKYSNGSKFTTKDNDNDIYYMNCAQSFKGAWWYGNCHHSNLNGLYLHGVHSSLANGVNWHPWRGQYYSLKKTTMMIKRQ